MGILKKFVSFVAVVGLCLHFSCMQVHASFTESDIDVYIRFKPLKTVMPKVINFAKEAICDEYFNAQCDETCAILGHPDYEGLSSHSNVVIFAFDGCKPQNDWLCMAKFHKNSPMKAMAILGKLAVKDIKDWTFISKNAEELDKLVNADWLIEIADSAMKHDAEICCAVSKLTEDMNIDTINNFYFKPLFGDKLKALEEIEPILSVCRDEMDSLRKICLAVNFNGSSTMVTIQLKAKPGSKIGTFWSSKAGGSTKLPQFMFDREPYASFFMNLDQKACNLYNNKLAHDILRASSYLNADLKYKEMLENEKMLNEKSNGQAAIYVVPVPGKIPGVVSIVGGKFDTEDACVVLSYQDIIGSVLCSLTGTKQSPMELSQHYYKKAKVYSDTDGELYACACMGYLVSSTSKDLLEKAIDNIYNNKTRICLHSGNQYQGVINAKGIVDDFPCEDHANCPSDTKPIKFHSAVGNNKKTLYVTFDTPSMRALCQTFCALARECFKNDEIYENDSGGEESSNLEVAENGSEEQAVAIEK
jgi:hypothetical protein